MINLEKLFPGDSRQIRRRFGASFFALTTVLGLLQVYVCRYQMSPDAMDYLDIARQVESGHWNAVANGYWGTLQAVLLAPLFALHPSPAAELPLAHLHSLVILIATFFAFRWFLHTCLDSQRAGDEGPDTDQIPEWALCVVGYGLFLWSSLEIVPVAIIGPDLLVTAFVYLAAAALLKLQPEAPLRSFLLFGVILGVGYWAKAIMFPIGLFFLLVSIMKSPNSKKNLISVLAFAAIAAPLIAALSIPRERFTFGDSGTMNYATFVSPGGRSVNWQGLPAGSGTPRHPTRQLAGPLPIYEFNGPIPGTYPPSYDPSYWNEGHKSTFNPRTQLAVIAGHVPSVVELLLLAQPALTAGFLFLLLWDPGSFTRRFLRHWELPAVSLAIIGLYMLVHFETRFVGAFVVLIWVSAFLALRVPSWVSSRGASENTSRQIAGLAILALVAVMILSLASDQARKYINGCGESARGDVTVAQQIGLSPGTPVAVVGSGNYAYWAHLAQLRIVADIMQPDELAFWRLPADKRQLLYANFRNRTGAQWLIAQPPTVLLDSLDTGWREIGTTAYYRYPLQEQPESQPPQNQNGLSLDSK